MTVKIDIVAGFLGAGKTSFIKKLLDGLDPQEKTAIVENEFGEVSIDAVFLENTTLEITEINAGCICCNFQGDFQEALEKITEKFSPDRIIIEPSGIAKLSEVESAVNTYLEKNSGFINIKTAVIDPINYEIYKTNFADFFMNQIKNASSIAVSKTQFINPDECKDLIKDIVTHNPKAAIITQNWEALSPIETLTLVENSNQSEPQKAFNHKVLHTDNYNENKNNFNGSESSKQFENWTKIFQEPVPKSLIHSFINNLMELSSDFGLVLRAKGILYTDQNEWVGFNYLPGQRVVTQVTTKSEEGKINVIGIGLNKGKLDSFWDLSHQNGTPSNTTLGENDQ